MSKDFKVGDKVYIDGVVISFRDDPDSEILIEKKNGYPVWMRLKDLSHAPPETVKIGDLVNIGNATGKVEFRDPSDICEYWKIRIDDEVIWLPKVCFKVGLDDEIPETVTVKGNLYRLVGKIE